MTTDLARTIAALPDDAYHTFWTRLTRELNYLCDTHGEDEGITRFQERLDARARQQETRR